MLPNICVWFDAGRYIDRIPSPLKGGRVRTLIRFAQIAEVYAGRCSIRTTQGVVITPLVAHCVAVGCLQPGWISSAAGLCLAEL